MSANAHDIKVLNNLIEGLIDCSDGYSEAARQVDDPRYSQWFERRASERLTLTEQLKAEVRGLGGSTEDNGSILSKAQRAFSGFAAAILGTQSSPFETVRASENRLIEQFETAASDSKLAATTRETIRRGLSEIAGASSDLAALTDYLEPDSARLHDV